MTMRRANRTSGILEITIDESGAVVDAMMREPVNPIFDSLVLDAAKTWQYRPATKSGRSVRYIKRISVSAALMQ